MTSLAISFFWGFIFGACAVFILYAEDDDDDDDDDDNTDKKVKKKLTRKVQNV